MRKILLLSCAAVSLSALTGCFAPQIPITGPGYGGIFTMVNAGLAMNPSTRHLNEPYIVVKEKVSGESSSTNYLHVISVGDSSYNSAVEDALKKAPGATDLIDVKVDLKKYSACMSFTRATVIVTGTAIKYKSSK